MPPLHPMIVHFPIVLTVVAGIIYLYAILRNDHRLIKIGFLMHVAGLLFSIGAIFTGDYEESNIAQNPAIHTLAETHETLAMISTWGLGLLGVWAYLRQHSTAIVERLGFLLMFWGMIGMLGYAAHLGGAMVFGHGAGVYPMQEHIRAAPPANAVTPTQP